MSKGKNLKKQIREEYGQGMIKFLEDNGIFIESPDTSLTVYHPKKDIYQENAELTEEVEEAIKKGKALDLWLIAGRVRDTSTNKVLETRALTALNQAGITGKFLNFVYHHL